VLREQLLDVFERMLGRYGPQHWWPGDTWFEMMVGAVLTQSAAWGNVEKAISNLKAADALSPEAIRAIDEPELARLIYPSGYYNAKARKLKALALFIGREYADDVESMRQSDMEALREELLGVHGIGKETADDILLYALDKPSFVIDSYTRRIFSRLHLAPEHGPYSAYRSIFTDNLPASVELFGEYHALIVSHCKDVCRKRPVCEGCCLLEICPTGIEATSA
jgi:endonuclease-3 related protein